MKKATTIMKTTSGPKEGKAGDFPSRLIDARIKELGDWRGEMLARVRMLIKQADPEVVEELKWVKPTNPGGVPVWSHAGMICTGETYKSVVKSPRGPRSRTLQASSTPASKAIRGAPSISMRATRSMKRR